MKRESGENPGQSRCCEPSFYAANDTPLALCREGDGDKTTKSEDLPLR